MTVITVKRLEEINASSSGGINASGALYITSGAIRWMENRKVRLKILGSYEPGVYKLRLVEE